MRWTPCDTHALVAYLRDEFSDDLASEIEGHLRFCSKCTEAVARLRTFVGSLSVAGRLAADRQFAATEVPALLRLPRLEWHARIEEDHRFKSIEAAWAILAEADRRSEDRPRDAIAYYELAVYVSEEIANKQAVPSHELRVAAWKDLAWTLRRVGEYERAEEALDTAAAIAELCADRESMQARVTLARAILQTSMQRLDLALDLVRDAKATFIRINDTARYEMAVEQEANILLSRRDGVGAVALLQDLIAQPADDATRARRFANIAHAFELAGAVTAARLHLEKACAIHQRLGSTYWLVKETWTLGRIRAKEGDIPGALEALADAGSWYRELEDPDGAVLVDLNRSELEIEHCFQTPDTYERLREAVAYAIEKRLPESTCTALTFLRDLGRTVNGGHIRYVSDFILDLQRHPHRLFIPPEVAA